VRAQLRLAARSLVHARAYTAATFATTALAVGAACSVFVLASAVLLHPLPYANPDRLVGMWHTLPGVDFPVAKQSLGTYELFRESSKSFDATGV
jgi:hypothetical protein